MNKLKKKILGYNRENFKNKNIFWRKRECKCSVVLVLFYLKINLNLGFLGCYMEHVISGGVPIRALGY